MSRVCILGAGSWGMALAKMLAETGHDTVVWTFHSEKLDEYKKTKRYPKLDCGLPDNIGYEKTLSFACAGRDIIVTAVPSVNVRAVMRQAAQFIPGNQIVVNVSKGIESETMMTLTDVIEDEMHSVGKSVRTVALSGPTHAEELVKNLPSTIVSASSDAEAAKLVQDIFMNDNLRVYTNDDMLGVELCGAMKNIIAIASGICIGVGFGDNSKAALITRGLAEMTRLGLAMGCKAETFAGLAGMGDLIVTATSRHSRNFQAGYLLGQGMTAEEAKEKIGMVVEGINALPAVLELSEKYGVELPICLAVDSIVNCGCEVPETVRQLMQRDRKSEGV
ncbi:MAG: NAD(P)-dependent glycerol-3-phosphate dehydrogenase [Clostridiales bacterium]|nr:NAD(P)-dependent glycerol-3-phosphate dehydrogenase [Clostridiales bacterium]MDO5140000.1 NAD(P)H-dependent glycerol-3-phosphate dehydrogenase [Eubacteriales bacterium]